MVVKEDSAEVVDLEADLLATMEVALEAAVVDLATKEDSAAADSETKVDSEVKDSRPHSELDWELDLEPLWDLKWEDPEVLPSVVWVVVSLVLKLLREVLADKLKQPKIEDNATEIHSEKNTLPIPYFIGTELKARMSEDETRLQMF